MVFVTADDLNPATTVQSGISPSSLSLQVKRERDDLRRQALDTGRHQMQSSFDETSPRAVVAGIGLHRPSCFAQ
ncbi:hypothetical protein CDL15_Pgr023412 [Punica granatum]|uniref:Uncharacterized protein n=1 Tax=Punica granatum TaxID=22663 RepID=A0A218Y2K7_PUNGR|nr:hypothetical protein CDL15_Pgr023412 [Punica granatum]PKI51346.1 hypothetical protein CRG98_028293 [Punica granatum]